MAFVGRYVLAGLAVGITLFVVGWIQARAALPTALLLYLLPVVLARIPPDEPWQSSTSGSGRTSSFRLLIPDC